MNFRVVVSDKALEELQGIYDYIADSGSPQTAEDVLEELQRSIASLNYMPVRCRLFDVEPWRSKGVRIMVAVSGAFGIYYTVEADNVVRVHHVFNNRMDAGHWFNLS